MSDEDECPVERIFDSLCDLLEKAQPNNNDAHEAIEQLFVLSIMQMSEDDFERAKPLFEKSVSSMMQSLVVLMNTTPDIKRLQ